MSDLRELVLRNRSYRRFHEEQAVSRETLLELVDLARQTASAANRQPLKYLLSSERETNARIFPCLSWAAYLKDWRGPGPGERPAAYVVVLVDETITTDWWCDDGIAAQTLLLGATERGLGGCMIGAIRHRELRDALHIPEHFRIRLVVALGYPAEEVRLEAMGPDGDIRYWRDEKGVHHVPKRRLEDILLD